MDLKDLKDTPPWDWPKETGEALLRALNDTQSKPSDRLLAAELAGDFVVVNDALANALLEIARNVDESVALRAQATSSLGPAFEGAETAGFDDPNDSPPITEPVFRKIDAALRELHADAGTPKDVRRRALEVSVRAIQDWHPEAIRAAFASGDREWRLTAVSCMRWIRGFDDEILEALESEDPEIHYEAVCAAGNAELDGAWSHIADLVNSEDTEKELLLAAIDALANIRPEDAFPLLFDLIDSTDDDDIEEAAYEAMSYTEHPFDEDSFDETDDLNGNITVQ